MRRRDVAIATDGMNRGSVLSKGMVWQIDIARDGAVVKLEAFTPSS